MASGDQEPEGARVAEGGADADSLRRGVRSHHTDDHQRFSAVGSAQRPEVELTAVAHSAVGERNEDGAGEGADGRPAAASVEPFEKQARAGAEHHAGGDGVGGSEPAAGAAAFEQEGQGAETGRERGRERREEDGGSGHGALLGRAGRDERPAHARPRPAAPLSPDARHRARGGAAPGTGRATCPRLPSAPGRQCRTHAAIARRVARGRSFGRAPGGPCGPLPEQEQRARSSIQMLRGGARGGIGAVPDLRLGLLLMPLAFEQNPHIAAMRASSAVGTIRA